MSHGFVIWLTGLPASGKTTLANVLAPKLTKLGFRVERLDGDELRAQLSPDLGFTKQDRALHAKRVVFISKLLARNGVVVIASLISPYRSFRRFAREYIGDFIEVYVKCSVQTCIKRDPKGIYRKALVGEINNLTGIQDPYEEPINPEVLVNTELESPEQGTERILCVLRDLGCLNDAVIPLLEMAEDDILKHVMIKQST